LDDESLVKTNSGDLPSSDRLVELELGKDSNVKSLVNRNIAGSALRADTVPRKQEQLEQR